MNKQAMELVVNICSNKQLAFKEKAKYKNNLFWIYSKATIKISKLYRKISLLIWKNLTCIDLYILCKFYILIFIALN